MTSSTLQHIEVFEEATNEWCNAVDEARSKSAHLIDQCDALNQHLQSAKPVAEQMYGCSSENYLIVQVHFEKEFCSFV
jgi:hypothetical protein